ncbi:MAG: aldo/keto reductase [Capnocytophaga sp.]|nr:aldo/keto reductase [Capnocytophaga sp.]
MFRGRENDVIPVCEELGIGFVPWSPLGMGTLCGYVDERTRFNNPPEKDLKTIIPRFSEQAMKHNLALYQMIDRFAKEKGCTTAQFALAWLQAQKPFIVAIPGTTKGYHLLENLGATDITFTTKELIQYRNALDSFTVEGLRLPEMILNFSEVR